MNEFLRRLRGSDPVLMLAIRGSRTADVVRIARSTGHHAEPGTGRRDDRAACVRHGKLLMVGGIPDPALLNSLAPLGACPLRLTGTDTDMLYAGAAVRAERFLT